MVTTMNIKRLKSYLLGLLTLVMLLGSGSTYAQEAARVSPRSIFEALEASGPNLGKITIHQSEEVRRLVGNASSRYNRILSKEGNTALVWGYRIQFFNGNQSNSRAIVQAREQEIKLSETHHNTYIIFNAPFWRLLVGDFATMGEARQARARLLKILPDWARESYIVRDKVRIINYNSTLEEGIETL